MASAIKTMGRAARRAAYAVGAICLVAAVAGLLGRFDPWLDLPNHFAPVWLAGAIAVAAGGGVAARGRRRLALVLLGLAAAAAAAPRVIPELTRPIRPAVAPDPGAYRLRLIQFNVWDETADPRAVAAWIDRQSPDVVTVEEATPALTTALTARGFTAVPGVVSTAIFSRGVLSAPPFRVPFEDWTLAPDFARARFVIGAGPATFTVVAAHLTWPSVASHWPQREAFARLLDDQTRDRLIVAGDFNLTPWSFALGRLDQRLRLERRDRAIPSWPALTRVAGRLVEVPALLPIDHVYAGSHWRTVAIRRGPRMGSDHYPLIVDLALTP